MALKPVKLDRTTMIKKRHQLDDKRKVASAALKAIEDEIAELDALLIEDLNAANEERVEIKGGMGVRLVASTVPTVDSWDDFYAWVHKNKAYWMLERRPSVTGYRDVLASGKTIPGVKPFTKVKVALVR